MKGICIICDCTERNPCFHVDDQRPCGWIDSQQDLCSCCSLQLLASPIDDKTEMPLVFRALRAALVESMAEAAELREAIALNMLAASNRAAARVVWTPGEE